MTPRPDALQRALTTTPAPTRRTVLRSTAWSVPAVAVAGAAPAFAASRRTTTVTIVPVVPQAEGFSSERCERLGAGDLSFVVTASTAISATAEADKVAITLPEGLVWSDGSPATRRVSPAPQAAVAGTYRATVAAPEILVAGTAGAYPISATFRGVTTHTTMHIIVRSGTFRQITRQQGAPDSSPSFQVAATSSDVSDARTAAIAGDQSPNTQTSAAIGANLTVLLTNGSAQIRGVDLATQSLTYNGQTLTGLTRIASWTSHAWATTDALASSTPVTGQNAAGAAVSTNSTGPTNSTTQGVWLWFRDRSASGNSSTSRTTRRALRVAKVTGLPANATVLGLWAHGGMGHVLLQGHGAYAFSTFLTNTTTTGTVAAVRIINTGATTLNAALSSVWGHHRRVQGQTTTHQSTYGGAVVSGRSMHLWSGAQNTGSETNGSVPALTVSSNSQTTRSVALPTTMTDPVKVIATDSGVAVLDDSGVLWTHGTELTAGWFQRQHDVVDFHAWGYHTDFKYLGGAWISLTGAVTQFLDHETRQSVGVTDAQNRPITGIRRVETADGTYLGLKWDGTLYGWNGNLNHTTTRAAVLTGVGTESAVDIGVWGFHNTISDLRRYNGGGFILTSPACAIDF